MTRKKGQAQQQNEEHRYVRHIFRPLICLAAQKACETLPLLVNETLMRFASAVGPCMTG